MRMDKEEHRTGVVCHGIKVYRRIHLESIAQGYTISLHSLQAHAKLTRPIHTPILQASCLIEDYLELQEHKELGAYPDK